MTEQDLIELGFNRNDITAEESGYQNDWYYYTYDFGNHLSLISSDNEEAQTKGWSVEIFDTEPLVRFTEADKVFEFISIIKSAMV